jgi:septum formation protein
MNKLFLASSSLRRREMLEKLGVPFSLVASNCDETLSEELSTSEAVREVALRKAQTAFGVLPSAEGSWVLAADTVVAVADEVMGKPADRIDAARMLDKLSGKVHRVYTGVALVSSELEESFTSYTDVHFSTLTGAQIRWYVGTDEPMDKAGAYAVQGLASAFIKSLRGSYSNVVGLPLNETMAMLEKIGFAPWSYKS